MDPATKRLPRTFWIGAALIAACEALLLLDVTWRGVAVLPPPPDAITHAASGALGHLARWVAVHMTPLCWVGYLFLFDGLLAARGRSPARLRPRRFAVCFVTGVAVWSFFDWVNFSFVHAWDYYGLEPLTLTNVLIAKFVAFGAISPAMFLTAAVYQKLGLARLRTTGLPFGRPWQIAMFAVGVPTFVYPFVFRDPIGCFGLWVGLVLVLDPVNHWLGRGKVPTLIGDWQAGRWGRTVSLMAAGLTCGFLWEFWNYWAAAKWVYHLPFLGPLEAVKLFEMPLPGFGGFLPFALECWVAFHAILLVMGWLRLRWFETLPDDDVL